MRPADRKTWTLYFQIPELALPEFLHIHPAQSLETYQNSRTPFNILSPVKHVFCSKPVRKRPGDFTTRNQEYWGHSHPTRNKSPKKRARAAEASSQMLTPELPHHLTDMLLSPQTDADSS